MRDSPVVKRKRRKDSSIDILNKPQLRNIFEIIGTVSLWSNKKVKAIHLIYALVDPAQHTWSKKHEKAMQKFFQNPFNKQQYIDRMNQHIAEGMILDDKKKEVWLRAIEKRTNILVRMKDQGKITNETLFPSDQALRNQLTRFTKMKLIDCVSDKKGWPYYKLSKNFQLEYDRFMLHRIIDERLPMDHDIHLILFDYIDYLSE